MYYKCIDKNHTLRKDTAEVATERAGLRVPNGYQWIPLEGMAKEKRKKNDLKKSVKFECSDSSHYRT